MNAILRQAKLDNAAARKNWDVVHDNPLKPTKKKPKIKPSISPPNYIKILKSLCQQAVKTYEITMDDLLGPSRNKIFVDARAAVVAEASSFGICDAKIGFYLGRRDTSTIRGLRKRGVKDTQEQANARLIAQAPALAQEVIALRERVKVLEGNT